jgi:predicted tellurium resistance membrane protein TerC
MYLTFNFFRGDATETKEDDYIDKNKNWLYKSTVGFLGVFWSTVALVEVMDMAFSLDNIFAVVAFSNNIILIIFGVFIGILEY